jgi:hypothetical protein
MAGDPTRWYWCLRHQRPETAGECPNDRRLGPYASPEEAARWAERAEARNEDWDEEDKRWRGQDD